MGCTLVQKDTSVATFEAQRFNICSLVIQVVSSTYEQIDNSDRISLVNGKQCSEPMGVLWGCMGVSVDPVCWKTKS